MMVSLSASVGKGGQNKVHDVAVMQAAMSFMRINPGPVDGKYGPKTEAGIAALQRHVNQPAGFPVNPNGPVLNQNGLQPMALNFNFLPPGAKQYFTQQASRHLPS